MYFIETVKDITFDFFGCFNIFCISFDGADESTDIWEVHLTANKVLQAFQAVPGFPVWPCLQMVNLSFKRLKYNRHTACIYTSYWLLTKARSYNYLNICDSKTY